jgi:hypothetical protein
MPVKSSAVDMPISTSTRTREDAQLRQAMTRAMDRGVSWRQIDEALHAKDEVGIGISSSSAQSHLDQLKPLPASASVEEERSASPTLETKRAAWQKLNSKFQD